MCTFAPLVFNVLFLCQVSAPAEQTSDDPFVSMDEVRQIVVRVSLGIESLKSNHPHLKEFVPARQTRINDNVTGFVLGIENNPTLATISYTNGVHGKKSQPNDGKKRHIEDVFDPDNGIRLNVHFFKGQSRGNDNRPWISIGDLNVHVYVGGPAAEPVRDAILQELNKIRKPLPSDPQRILAASLLNPGNELLRTSALEIIDKSQVISLRYRKDTPVEHAREIGDFIRTIEASKKASILIHHQGKKYPSLDLTFSRMFGDAENMAAAEWHRQMLHPIEAGYTLTTIVVVIDPPHAVKEKSLEKVRAAVESIAASVMLIKSNFKQLNEFEVTGMQPGGWSSGDWPRYPQLTYEHDVGANSKRKPERLSEDWCRLHFGVGPITGAPVARRIPSRSYAKLGIQATWQLESGSRHLNKRFQAIVVEALKPLDRLESEQ